MGVFNANHEDRYELLHFTYDLIEHETNKAWLIRLSKDKIWFPKSQCILNEDKSVIEVPRWMAEEKEIEDLAQ
jgi:hypothetical protein